MWSESWRSPVETGLFLKIQGFSCAIQVFPCLRKHVLCRTKPGTGLLNTFIMEYRKSFKLLPIPIPDRIQYERPAGLRQDGFNLDDKGIPIEELSEKDALEYAEFLKTSFISFWESAQAMRKN